MSRGVPTAVEAVMHGYFCVREKSVSGGSGPVIGFKACPGSDCEPSSQYVLKKVLFMDALWSKMNLKKKMREFIISQ